MKKLFWLGIFVDIAFALVFVMFLLADFYKSNFTVNATVMFDAFIISYSICWTLHFYNKLKKE